MKKKVNVCWFRRDLRLFDNTAFYYAAKSDYPVLPLFIFDQNIIDELPKDDARISFIYDSLKSINQELNTCGGSIKIVKSTPLEAFNTLLNEYDIQSVYLNKDYEPYAIKRDKEVESFLAKENIAFNTFKDHVVFEQNEITKDDGNPYTVFTPYSKKWKNALANIILETFDVDLNKINFVPLKEGFPSIETLGFKKSTIIVPSYSLEQLGSYKNERNLPAKNSTSKLSVHLRFGTVSVRQMVKKAQQIGEDFLNELIWREFFHQVLWHFPYVVNKVFKPKYQLIEWRNNEEEFEKWCTGKTGYPIVDAGMRELNQTGLMHNRVRMITASFLCKHLLIDWRWGEAYFAEKLLDFDLAINNGNWQWVAGTGCDAAPYFRVFNPTTQTQRFDPNLAYIKKWVPEFESLEYPTPIVDHKYARERALKIYKVGIDKF